VSFDEVLRVELEFLHRHAKNERAANDSELRCSSMGPIFIRPPRRWG
jgi:hypothetical protein